MRCSQFLELYSDYRDGLITDPRTAGEVRMHLAQCKRCMNYDAAISRGVMALRATSDIRPSRSIANGFILQLHQCQEKPSDFEGVRTAHAGIMAGLMTVAAVILLLGVGLGHEEEASEPRVAAANSAPPFLTTGDTLRPTLTDWNVPAYRRELPSDSEQQVSFDRWVSLTR